MKAKHLIAISVFFFHLSCTTNFIDRLSPPIEFEIKKLDKKNYCQEKKSFSLFNENKNSQIQFQYFLNKISPYYTLEFVDKSILWSLYQMNLRPDIASPHASIQILISINGQETYLSSPKAQKGTYPFLYALEETLIKYRSKYKLTELISIYDKYFTYPATVSIDFSNFLQDNKSTIQESKHLKSAYLRRDEVLKEGERIPKLKFKSLYTKYLKTKLNGKNYQALTKLRGTDLQEIQCSSRVKFNKADTRPLAKVINSYQYGHSSFNNYFYASTSISLPELTGNEIYFDGMSSYHRNTICKFKKNWIISTKSRDTAQHVQHLVEYGLLDQKSLGEYAYLINYPRHIVLSSPKRLIFESTKTDQKQVDKLTQLNIPLYGAKNIGNLNLIIQSSRSTSFIIDQRSSEEITCK